MASETKNAVRLFLSSRRHRKFRYSDALAVRTEFSRQLNGVPGVLIQIGEVLILDLKNLAFINENILFTGFDAVHDAIVVHKMGSVAHASADPSCPRLLSSEARKAGYQYRQGYTKNLSFHRTFLSAWLPGLLCISGPIMAPHSLGRTIRNTRLLPEPFMTFH